MFVGSGQQLSILTSEKYPPSLQNIGDHHSIEMTNMGGFSEDRSHQYGFDTGVRLELIEARTGIHIEYWSRHIVWLLQALLGSRCR